MKRLVSFLLTLVMLLSLATPASAAAVKTSGAATTLRLESVTGTVQMKNGSGKSVKAASNTRLYNGYKLSTKKASYAHVSLDDAKVIKLDASSGAEVFQSGKKLELKVTSGQMFFNVSEPLKGNESLTIRTSTMVTGVRGTSGWVKVIDRNTTRISLLEGKLTITSVDPVTGKQRVTTIVAGQTATIVYHGQDKKPDGTVVENETIRDLIEDDVIHDEHIVLKGNGLTVENLQEHDVPGFVAKEVKDDKELQKKIEENSPLSVPEIIGDADARLESAEKAAEEEEKTILEKLKDLVADTVAPLFKDDAAASGSGGGSGGGGAPVTYYDLVILRVNEDGMPITTDGYGNQVTTQSSTYGVEGTEYSAGEPINIPGYVYVGLAEGSDPERGIMDADKTVIYQYRTTNTTYALNITYRVESSDGILVEERNEQRTLFEGEAYDLPDNQSPTFTGYGFLEISEDSAAPNGIMSEATTVTLVYRPAYALTILEREYDPINNTYMDYPATSATCVQGASYQHVAPDGYIIQSIRGDLAYEMHEDRTQADIFADQDTSFTVIYIPNLSAFNLTNPTTGHLVSIIDAYTNNDTEEVQQDIELNITGNITMSDDISEVIFPDNYIVNLSGTTSLSERITLNTSVGTRMNVKGTFTNNGAVTGEGTMTVEAGKEV